MKKVNFPKILIVGNVYKNKVSGLSFSVPVLMKGFMKNGMDIDFLNLASSKTNKLNKKQIRQYDIIVLNSFFQLKHLFILLLCKKGMRIVVTPRAAFTNENKYLLKKRIYSICYFGLIKLRRLDLKAHYLTKNEENKSRFRKIPSFTVGNAIDEKSISTSLKQLNKDKVIHIVYMGRFNTYIKGLDLLKSHICRNYHVYQEKNVIFDFYGSDCKDKNLLKNYFQKNKIKNVVFHNPVFGVEKIRVLKEATFHIMTSRIEGFPMAFLESVAQGCPQILSEGTNMLPLLNEFSLGFSFDNELPKKIETLNVEQYKKMSMGAIRCAKNHMNIKIAKATYEGYIS